MSVTERKCKVCLLGDVGVGKTSLVTRFVHGGYSEKYLTTVGVKIDTRSLTLPSGPTVKFVLWDIAGADALSEAGSAYARGAGGIVLVADGTRPDTLEVALRLRAELDRRLGGLPFVALLNKRDLFADTIGPVTAPWRDAALPFVTTSALTGENVEFAFSQLALQVALR